MSLKPSAKPIETEQKSSFPLLLQYVGDSTYTMVNSPKEIVSGKGFKVIETNFGS